MPYTNYNAMVSSAQILAEQYDSVIVGYLPEAVRLATTRLEKEIDLDILSTNTEVTTTSGNRLLTKATGFQFLNNAYIVTSGGREVPLKVMPTDYLRDYWPVPTSTAEPVYIATDYSETQYMVAPTPASAYTVRLNVRNEITPISSGNQTNILTRNCGDVYFFATMSEVATLQKNNRMKQDFEEKYINAITGNNNKGRRSRRMDGGTASDVQSGKNTVLGTR
jgi:hypothetical protein